MNHWPGGVPAREWARRILAGTASIDQAPEKHRALIQDHIDSTVNLIKSWVQLVLAGRDQAERRRRLGRCPARMRAVVEAAARAEFERRKLERGEPA